MKRILVILFLVNIFNFLPNKLLAEPLPGMSASLISSPAELIENVPTVISFSCKNTTENDMTALIVLTATYGQGGLDKIYIRMDSNYINNNPVTLFQNSQSYQWYWSYGDIILPSGGTFTFKTNFTPIQDIKNIVGQNLLISFSCFNKSQQEMNSGLGTQIPVSQAAPTPTPAPTTIAPTQAVQPTATVAQTVTGTQTPTPTVTKSTNELEPVSYITENTDTDSQEDITDNVGEQIPVILSPTTVVALSSAGIISAAGIGFLQFKTHFISSLVLKLLKLFRFK